MLEEYLEPFHTHLNIIGPLYRGHMVFKDPVIFVDGGSQHKKNCGFSVGDNDSYAGSLDLVLPKSKDYSDLAFVLGRIPEKFQLISLWGFLGGRADHEIINLGETCQSLKSKNQTQILFDDKVICISPGDWKFKLEGLFSLFSFTDNQISLSGECRYKLQNSNLKAHSSQGLSNIAQGEIFIQNAHPLCLYINL